MFPAAEEIIERFEENEIHFRVAETDVSTRISADVIVDYTAFTVVFISDNEENDVSVRVPHFVRFKESDRKAVLRTANEMNEKYRFCKFTVNGEAEAVTIEYDFPEKTGNIGEAAVEIFRRIMQIAEDVFPEFMRAIWAKQESYSLGSIEFHDYQVE